MEPPIPGNEEERLKALRELDLLDTPAEERFDRLTRLAGRLFQVPVSMITLIDHDRQWFKSARGHLLKETPRVQSFCQYTILADEPLVVEDALSDPRFFDLPAVFDLGIRFYAGVPVRFQDGQAVGTLCVLDYVSHAIQEADKRALQDLARCAETELQVMSFQQAERELLEQMDGLRRQASIDDVSRCWNAPMGRELLARMLKTQRSDGERGLGVLLLTLNRLDAIGEQLGHEARDFALRESAERIRQTAPESFVLARSDLATFMVALPNLGALEADAVVQKICDGVGKEPHKFGSAQLPLEVSGGLALCAPSGQDEGQVLEMAMKALGRARFKGANSFCRAI